MKRRKPLPYAASYLIDQAMMNLADAHRELLKTLDGCPSLDAAISIGRSLDRINAALHALKEVKQT